MTNDKHIYYEISYILEDYECFSSKLNDDLFELMKKFLQEQKEELNETMC